MENDGRISILIRLLRFYRGENSKEYGGWLGRVLITKFEASECVGRILKNTIEHDRGGNVIYIIH